MGEAATKAPEFVQITLDSTGLLRYTLLTKDTSTIQYRLEDTLVSALIKMGGGTGPVKPDNPSRNVAG